MRKIKNKILIAIIFLYFCFFYGCALNSDNDSEDLYPTAIYSLSDSKLEQLQSEFDKLNNNKIGTRLDQFGYTGYTMVYIASEAFISDSNTVKQMAITALIKNSKFTNVSKESSLSLNRMFQTSNNSWKIFFNEQVYKGLRVEETTLTVYLNSDGVYRLDNHFFKDIYIPPKTEYSESEVKESLLGREIKYYPNRVYIITDSSFSGIPSEKVIIPVQTDTQIEFRVAWKINIGESGFDWAIYVDTITGEEIKIIQNFIT